jgi:hypothetical protein
MTSASNSLREDWGNLQNVLQQVAQESLGTRRNGTDKRVLRKWDDDIGKIIIEKEKLLKSV